MQPKPSKNRTPVIVIIEKTTIVILLVISLEACRKKQWPVRHIFTNIVWPTPTNVHLQISTHSLDIHSQNIVWPLPTKCPLQYISIITSKCRELFGNKIKATDFNSSLPLKLQRALIKRATCGTASLMFPISQFLTIYALIPKGNFQFHKLPSFLSRNLERKKIFLGNMENCNCKF